MEDQSSYGMSVNVEEVVNKFLELFDSIRLVAPKDEYPIAGCRFLTSMVRSFVETNQPIGLVLPAFPAKSPNVVKKVLGPLPDRGEELALGVLEGFCKNVESFYSHGAKVVIFSDGRVFSDLLAITLEVVGAYHQECKRMVADAGYTHIHFDTLENHLAKDCASGPNLDQATLMHKLLEAFGTIDLDAHLESDVNLLKLQRSIKCFLRLDLEPSKDVLLSEFEGASQNRLKKLFKQKCDQVSKSMVLRNMAFSKLVEEAYPDMIRISIHAHNNAGPKFGICLIPGQDRCNTPHTPWHNVIVETACGQTHIMRREMVDLSNFEVYEHPVYNRPWGYKEKSLINNQTRVEDMEKLMISEAGAPKLLNAYDITGILGSLPIVVKPLHPCGIVIQCVDLPSLTPLDIPSDTLRGLTMQFGVVLLRGFQEVESPGDKLVETAGRIGEIVYWTNFGAVLDVKEVPGTGGSVMSSQALPFHWDGSFKFHNSQLQEITCADTPGFVLFQCVKPPVVGDIGGETLLTDTRRILRSSINAEKLAMLDLASLEAEYYSPASGYFGGRWIQHKFVSPHPITGEPTLRYLEPWPESKSAKQWTIMRAAQEADAPMVAEASELVQELIYNEELFCYKHSWMANDFLFLDNHAVLHARTSFTHGSERHIRRIHFN
ncbi:hypothetical protein KC19_12G012800 [Ceratodon purpureus]|uniref:TauD/TfdA-like domain-containing protein n=1 Tax=Ceratodon purpureus TaxID=3225 RepID=A0A8T0G4T2_CERPU|nr:hypothetical protein KC19_12G012700 [Ceratodon purpureus]KAG0553457.1 hypothetical protein KC19_12G012800 [Ceratodon purpureus]